MKKFIRLLLILIVLVSSSPVSALTITGKSIDSGTNIRSGASTKYSVIGTSKFGDTFKILESVPSENVGSCSSDWYKFDVHYNTIYQNILQCSPGDFT